MKFIKTSKSQWYAKVNDRFYCIGRLGYMYRAFVADTKGNLFKDTVELFDTKKQAEQYLNGLVV